MDEAKIYMSLNVWNPESVLNIVKVPPVSPFQPCLAIALVVCFTCDISIADNWHLTFYTFHLDMAMHGIRVDFMQVAFQSWHEIGPCSASCSVSLLTLFRIPIPEPATTRRYNHKYEGWAFGTHRNLEQSQPNVDDTDFHIFISKIISENICRPVLCILRHSVALS